ncbi:ABC transporter substrate-binding protein [Pseudomonas sp. dw_358]|uniref:substrate-binding periplasmic protein n=1 Tax=Pseudomonas sp. dw_358 TaxID=2720083 RepID=UPI001BD4D6AF|nr:ABC transporter substrate-binding protein [Pseudomonas sp. dw_358]
MLKRLLLASMASLCLSIAGGTQAAEVPADYSMVLLTENFPPYNMAAGGKNFAQEENISGIAADIVREMFKRAGIAYNMTLRFPWDRIYKLALQNPNCGVFVTARNAERESAFKWVGPIGPDDWIMLARDDSKLTLDNLEQARHKKIGAYKGDVIAVTLAAKGFEPVVALRDQDNAKKLQSGEIDLWATGDPSGRYLARLEGVGHLKTVLRFNSDQLYLAINKDTPDEVVTRLQKALDAMRADGFVDQVMAKYL